MEKRRGIPNTTVESSREKEENEAICDQGVWRIRVSETTMKGLREIRIRLSLSSYEEVFCVLLASYKEATGSRTSQSSDTLHEGGYPRNKESGLDNDGIKTMADEEVTLEIKEEPCETYSIVKEEDTLNPLQEEMSGDHRTESERTLQNSGKPRGAPETSLEHHNLAGRWTGGSEARSMHGQRDVGPNDSMMDGRLEDGWTEDDDDDGGKEMDVPQSSEGTLTCFIKEEPEDSDSTEDEGSNLHDIPSCSQQGGNSSMQSSYQRMENSQKMSGDASHDRSHGKHLPEEFNLSARASCPSEYDSYLLPNQVDYPQGQSSASTMSDRNGRFDGDIAMGCSVKSGMSGDVSCDTSHAQGQSSANSTTMLDHNDGRLDRDLAMGCGVKSDISSGASCDRSHAQGQNATDSVTMANDDVESLYTNADITMECSGINETAYPEEDGPFICSVCSKWFKYRKNMYIHMIIHGKNFDQSTLYKKRIQSGKSFSRRMRTPTGHKSHVCIVCGRGFRTADNLKAHRAIHTGEKSVKSHQR